MKEFVDSFLSLIYVVSHFTNLFNYLRIGLLVIFFCAVLPQGLYLPLARVPQYVPCVSY